MSELHEAWRKLEVSAPGGDGFVRLRLSEPEKPALYAGRRRNDGYEALLLEVPTAALPPELELPRAEGLEIRGTPVVRGPGGRTCLHVAFADERYRDVFSALAVDIYATVIDASSDADAVLRFVARIERWQAFLRRHGPGGLSLEAQRGLFGELWFMQRLLEEGLAAGLVVARWRGPDRDAHDFQLPAVAIEVKTTKAATPKAIPFSNIKQLDDRGLPMLLIYLLQVEESSTAPLSLPQLVKTLKDRFEERCRNLFDEKLFDIGYTEEQFAEEVTPRYAIRRERWFHVAKGFPRLLEPDLPPGIIDVKFSVNLAACLPYESQREDVIPALRISVV